MALATLTIDLVAKLANLERDLGMAVRVAEKHSKRMESAFEKAGTALRTIGAGFAVGTIVAKLEQMGKAAIDGMEALVNLRAATGSTIENLSALEDIAARSGNAFEVVSSAVVKFNMVLKDSKPGSDAEAAFKALNLNINELKDLDPAEALRRTAVAMAGFADDGNKARLAMELFGRKLPEIADFLRDLGAQSELVAKVTTEEAEAAKKFNDEISAMSKNLTDLSRVMVGPLVSGFNTMVAKFKEGRQAGEGWFAFNRRMLAEGFGYYMPSPQNADLGGAGLAAFAGANDQSAAETARLARSKRSIGPLPDSTKPKKASDGPEGTRNATSELLKYAEQLSRAAEKTRDLSAVEEARLRIAENLSRFTSPLLVQQIMANAKIIDDTKELTAGLEEQFRIQQAMWAAEEQHKEMIASLDAELEQLSGRAADNRKRELTARLEAKLKDNPEFVTPEQLEKIVKGIAGINEELEKSKSIGEELGMVFASAFEDAILSGKKFSDVLKGLAQDILRIILRKAVTEKIASAVTGLFGFDEGSDYVPHTGLAMVHKGERIIPASQNKGGMQGGNNYYFTVGDVASVSMVQQAIARSQAQTAHAMNRALNYGGALS